MKHYHILECKDISTISFEIYNFLAKENGPLSNTDHFWNFLPKDQVYLILKECPTLKSWLGSLKLKVREASFTVYNEIYKTTPHVDAPPVVAKINIPVLNTKDTFNVWFDDNDKEIDRVECVVPVVLRSDVKHTVEIGDRAVFPRIQLSLCFYNEPIDYLE